MKFTFEEGKVLIGSSIFSSPFIKIESFFITPEKDIPINANNMYLLCFAANKSDEQLKKLGVESLINKARKGLLSDIKKALGFLEQYDIKYDELYTLIQQKINEKR